MQHIQIAEYKLNPQFILPNQQQNKIGSKCEKQHWTIQQVGFRIEFRFVNDQTVKITLSYEEGLECRIFVDQEYLKEWQFTGKFDKVEELLFSLRNALVLGKYHFGKQSSKEIVLEWFVDDDHIERWQNQEDELFHLKLTKLY